MYLVLEKAWQNGRAMMSEPTRSQIVKSVKEGIAEVLENMQKHMAEMDKKLEEIKRRLDNGNG